MKATRRNSALYRYLNERGVLERGNPEEIAQAKKEYRAMYQHAYKQKYKQSKKEFSILLNSEEAKELTDAAEAHALPVPVFMRKAVFAYIDRAYITPHVHILHQLQQILLRSETLIRRIADKDTSTSWFRSGNYGDLERIINNLRSEITNAFTKPPEK